SVAVAVSGVRVIAELLRLVGAHSAPRVAATSALLRIAVGAFGKCRILRQAAIGRRQRLAGRSGDGGAGRQQGGSEGQGGSHAGPLGGGERPTLAWGRAGLNGQAARG